MFNLKKTLMLSILLFNITLLYADESVKDILSKFDPITLDEPQAIQIMALMKDAGYKGGSELNELIKAQGFDPEAIRALAPPPEKIENTKYKRDGKIYSSLTQTYGKGDFEINSLAINNGELGKAYRCENKISGTEKLIPLSWDNVPTGTKSLAIVMYHFPKPNVRNHANSYLLLWGLNPAVRQIIGGEAANGDWFMGQNKDGNEISYTSPCSAGPGTHQYTIAIFALAEYPVLLPHKSTINVNFDMFMTAIEDVKILGKATVTFSDTTTKLKHSTPSELHNK
jgi:phosphatidylethanolamine-binding protein (PEBP) family uncharacterized protein